LQYWPPYSEPTLGQQPEAAVVFGQPPGFSIIGQPLGVSVFAQQPGVPAFGQQAGVSMPGQHGDVVFAFSLIMQVAFSAPTAFNPHALLLPQGLLNGHRPVVLPLQGRLLPFDSTEWAATAQAATITRMNNPVFRLLYLPELEEQHSPPESGELASHLFSCVIPSFVSILFPQK
jgi:hypothetical protein